MRFQLAIVLAVAVLGGGCPNDDDDGGFGGGGGGGGGTSGSGVGDCPGGPTCSPKTPDGLDFSGAEPTFGAFPPDADTDHDHIAAGGTDVIQLRDDGAPFDLPFAAEVDDPSALAVDSTSSTTVTLRGLGGTTELDIVDPSTNLLFDRYAYASSPISIAAAVPGGELAEMVGDDVYAFAFAPGDLSIGVALIDDEVPAHRLVDTGAVLAVDGGSQLDWDDLALPGAAVGHHAVTITAGATVATADVDVVDHADAVVRIDSFFDDVACFGGEVTASSPPEFIVGLAWTFTVDGEAADASVFGTNCVQIPYDQTSPVTITAAAGGQIATVQVASPQ